MCQHLMHFDSMGLSKIVLYNSHCKNIIQHHVPPFSSSIHFELYKRNDEYYVQLFYKKGDSQHARLMEFPNCDTTKCPLHRIYDLYSDVLPDDNETFQSLCRS